MFGYSLGSRILIRIPPPITTAVVAVTMTAAAARIDGGFCRSFVTRRSRMCGLRSCVRGAVCWCPEVVMTGTIERGPSAGVAHHPVRTSRSPALGRLGGLRRENERAPGGAPSFAESVSLSSTVLADSRLPPNAFEIGFDLLALRARREREPMASGGSAQEARDRKSPQIRRTSSWTALHARQRNVAVK